MIGEGLIRAARYERVVGASIERVWENVRDWEHLPWLHSSAFAGIDCLEEGDWGWRADIRYPPADSGQSGRIELVIDAPGSRYVARTLEGSGQGAETWTWLTPEGSDKTAVRVEFWIPEVPPETAEHVGRSMVALYTRLWDEDEGMMVERSARLAQGAPARGPESLDLGPLAEVRQRLPFVVEAGGRRYRVVEVDGELLAHSAICPHLLGPLEEKGESDAEVQCPWHGYRFDVRSGRSCDGERLRLPPAPRVRRGDDDRVRLEL